MGRTIRLVALVAGIALVTRIAYAEELAPSRRLGQLSEPAIAVAWSADSHLVATGHADGVVRVWDVEHGTELAIARGYRSHSVTNSATGMAFSPDGRWLAFGVEGGAVRLWEFRTGSVTELAGNMLPVTVVAFDSDGKRLASASGGAGYRSAVARSTEPTTRNSSGTLGPLVIDPMTITVFDLENRQIISRPDATGFLHVGFSADLSRFVGPKISVTKQTTWPLPATAPETRTCQIEVRETMTGKTVGTLPVAGWSSVLSPDGKSVLNGGIVWNVESGKAICDVGPNAKLFSRDGKTVLNVGQGAGGYVKGTPIETRRWIRFTYVDLGQGSRSDAGRYVFDRTADGGSFAAFEDPQRYSPNRDYVIDGSLRLWSVPRPQAGAPVQTGATSLTPDQQRAFENPKTAAETVGAVGVALQGRTTAEHLSRFFWSKDDADGKLARAVAERVLASRRVVETYARRFPGADTLPAGELGLVTPGDFFTLALGTWAEAGDQAKFVSEPSIMLNGIPVSMCRVQGIWKLDVTPVNDSATRAVEAVTRHTAIVVRAADDLDAGRIKSPDVFREVLAGADRTGVSPAGLRHVPDVIPGR